MKARRIRILPILLLLLAAAPACHHDDNAVLLVVVTASGTPQSVAALKVTLTGPAGPWSNSYTHDGNQPITFPTTLTAQLPARAIGKLDVDVDALNAANVTVASGHGGPITINAGERQTVYIHLDCDGHECVMDGGTGGGDGGPPTPSPTCGNGRVDPGETCDTAIAAGAPGACPSSCDDHVPCTHDTPSGSDCMVVCAHEEILAVQGGDGCCPAGATDKEDSDCSGTCRNGIVDQGETCDLAIMRGVAGACPVAADCTPGAACATSLLVSAGTCSAVCMRYPIVVQILKDSDGCCPPGATNAVDEDCATACGNGVREQGESCDVGIPPLEPNACPTSCDDLDPCTVDFSSAIGCQISCQHLPITAPVSGDGCCPRDPVTKEPTTRATDTDCAPRCHNGVVEPGEACDGDCPTSCPPPPVGNTGRLGCVRVELVGSDDDCSARCVMTEETGCRAIADGCCPAGCKADTDPDCSLRCGNGAIDFTLGEECDTSAPASDPSHCPMSCADSNACTDDRLISAGTCSARCVSLRTTAFRPDDGCCPLWAGGNALLDPDCPPMCGNGVVESPAERCDSIISGSCPTSCPPQMGCTRYALQGSISTCSSRCVAMPITLPVDGDNCCPAGHTRADDADCPIICGDGVVEAGESCDRAITAGAPGACLRSCDDGIACTVDIASGSAEGCTRTCTHQPITGCVPDDGCCPQGCSAVNDRDCAPACGDGHIGAGETCDPPSTCPASCPDDGDPCTGEQLTGDASACNAVCRHAPITACSGTLRDSCCPTGCTSTNDPDC